MARAHFNLGVMYNSGRGISKDDAQVVAWYRKAARQRLAGAQAALRRKGLIW